jgi:hypoxanthine phosphoribosyltransferase
MKPPAPPAVRQRAKPVPTAWRGDLKSILISRNEIRDRLKEMAAAIEADHQKRDLVVVSVLTGTVLFLADLIRHISLPMRLDFIGVSSYRNATKPGQLVFTKELGIDVQGRDVLLIDDILDTGQTLHRVIGKLRQLKPRRIRTCVLLSKSAHRVKKIKAHYVGFEVPDEFVVGYGLDFAERYRNLPFIGVLKPEIYQQAAS